MNKKEKQKQKLDQRDGLRFLDPNFAADDLEDLIEKCAQEAKAKHATDEESLDE